MYTHTQLLEGIARIQSHFSTYINNVEQTSAQTTFFSRNFGKYPICRIGSSFPEMNSKYIIKVILNGMKILVLASLHNNNIISFQSDKQISKDLSFQFEK